jgi:hypothetical protein
MAPVARVFRIAATAAFATGVRAAAATYLVLTIALGAYAFLYGGAGADDLYPGAVFILLTAPVSIPAFLWLPASRVNTTIFTWVVVFLAPVGTVALAAGIWSAWRRLLGTGRRKIAHD